MFHMHTSFDLVPDSSISDFRHALDTFSSLMLSKDLLDSTGPGQKRFEHPIMDTDLQHTHSYFFVMSFRDREQCDAAVKHIQKVAVDSDPVHRAVYANIVNPIFSCWVDHE